MTIYEVVYKERIRRKCWPKDFYISFVDGYWLCPDKKVAVFAMIYENVTASDWEIYKGTAYR